jgi:hypothetical protein
VPRTHFVRSTFRHLAVPSYSLTCSSCYRKGGEIVTSHAALCTTPSFLLFPPLCVPYSSPLSPPFAHFFAWPLAPVVLFLSPPPTPPSGLTDIRPGYQISFRCVASELSYVE